MEYRGHGNMKDVTCRLFPDCVLFRLSMHYSLDSLKRFIKFAKKILDLNHLKNTIVDLRFMPESIPVMDRYELGVMIAEKFPFKYKLAVLAKREFITKFAETVAVNRGAEMLVSHDLKEIRKWFKSKE